MGAMKGLIILFLVASSLGQTSHHTSYGAPFGVPGHGSRDFLSPLGASSLASVMSALGLGPGGKRTAPLRKGSSNSVVVVRSPSESISQQFEGKMPFPGSSATKPTGSQRADLDPKSVRLLNDIMKGVMSPRTPETAGISGQEPFVIIIPQADSSTATRSETVQGNPGIVQISQNSIPGSSLISGSPADTPVLVLLDPASLQGSGSSKQLDTIAALTRSEIPSAALDLTSRNSAPGTTPQETLSTRTATLDGPPPFPSMTTSLDPSPKLVDITNSPPPSSNSPSVNEIVETGTTSIDSAAMELTDTFTPPPVISSVTSVDTIHQPDSTVVDQVNNAGTTNSITPVETGTPTSDSLTTSFTDAAVVQPTTPASGTGNEPQGVAMAINLPIVPTTGAVGTDPTGTYKYSFSVLGSDGIIRHETGKVDSTVRDIVRSFTHGNAVSTGSAASSPQVPAGPPTPVNIHGNYSHVEPTGKVFRVQYSHGEPTYVPVAPPTAPAVQFPLSAVHPFDFLLKRLSTLSTFHSSTEGVTRQSNANPGADSRGTSDPGTGTLDTGSPSKVNQNSVTENTVAKL